LLYLNFGFEVQVLPSYSSVAPVAKAVDYDHQKLKLLFVYLLLKFNLAVFKPVEFVQEVPLYSSVAAVALEHLHQKPKAAVCVPHLLKLVLLYLNQD
jgi:hypothetical protein